eukprot:6186037-Pleurochrysis_carterae.AAC.1
MAAPPAWRCVVQPVVRAVTGGAVRKVGTGIQRNCHCAGTSILAKVLLDERPASLAMGPDLCGSWRRTAALCDGGVAGTNQRGRAPRIG